MLLENKTAIVYGAGGSIGSSVARAYAREGAHVFLASRATSTLTRLADSIRRNGGAADVASVDVLDLAAVQAHVATVAAVSERIDVCFNATSNDDVQGAPLTEMTFEDFLRPVTKSVTAHYNIATSVAPRMRERHSGVILCMAGGREAIPRLGGAHVAWSALAGLCRQLAADLGPDGIRVSWILSPGSPEQEPDREHPDPEAGGTLLRRRPSLTDVADVAVFLASDWSRTITAAEINITGGSVVD